MYCGLRLLLMTFPGKSLPAAHSELHPTCLFHPSAVLVHLGFCSFPVFLFFHFFMLFFFFISSFFVFLMSHSGCWDTSIGSGSLLSIPLIRAHPSVAGCTVWGRGRAGV